MSDNPITRKRLIVQLMPWEHDRLLKQARSRGLSLSNYVRRALALPEERQGIRRQLKPGERKRLLSGSRASRTEGRG